MGRPKVHKTDKEKHVYRFYHNAKQRARYQNIPFDLTLDYVMSITTDECPIFKTPFTWKISNTGKGKAPNDSPTLDKIVPELGYTKGNVAFISRRANKMKDDGSMQDHYDIADWIWEQTHAKNAKKNTITPVPTRADQQVEIYPELGPFSATGTGEDSDDTHHHCGTISGEDLDHRSQASGGNSLGLGSKKVGTFSSPESEQDYGYSVTKNPWAQD